MKAALFLFSLAVLASGVTTLRGATISVFSNADSGAGTLRQAIFDALPGDTINFALSGFFSNEIDLTSDELVINKNVTIDGPGADRLTIRGSSSGFRIFHVAPASVTVSISGVTIQFGNALNGGGILNTGTLTIVDCAIDSNIGGGIANSGTLTVTNSIVSGNQLNNAQSSHGAGIANTGTVTLTSSTISGNSTRSAESYGGGIANTGVLTIASSTIWANETTYGFQQGDGGQSSGGGIANFDGGTLTITNSTVSGNHSYQIHTSQSSGGGIANFGGATLMITNSTVSGNQSNEFDSGESNGGGIANFAGAVLTMRDSTVSGNTVVLFNGTSTCGGGIFTVGGDTTALGTLVGGNSGASGPDVCGPLTSGGFNLVGNNADAAITPVQSSDQIGTPGAPIDPLLGPLQYNGGPTFTRALQSNSPAVNLGDPNAPARDQRGYVRAGVSDIGAFEFGGTVPVSLANISTRLRVETGDNVLIGGFILTGAFPKKVIVRAIGPSLPLTGVLVNPILELRNSSGALLASNDNWRTDQEAEINATGIPPGNDLESAIVTTLPANNSAYTAIVRGVNDGTGIALVEAYDLNRTVDSKLGNISTRGLVETGDNVLIAGTIVVGQDSQRVILRAIGPSLNISGKLADPTLELRDADGALVRSNDNWRTDQEAEIIATTIPPSNDLESAIVQTLTPGNYTAILRGVNGTTGIAVVEAYGLN